MVLVVLVVLIAVALLVALHLGAACLFTNRTDAQADLLLFLVHLDDLELMLRVDFQLDRNVVLVHRLGDMAPPKPHAVAPSRLRAWPERGSGPPPRRYGRALPHLRQSPQTRRTGRSAGS